MDRIKINENLMRRIVRAIDKAVSEDVPQYLRDYHKETNNAVIQLRGDCINENLRNLVIGEDIEFVSFRRYIWQGRIIVDRTEKTTYTITTQKTLRSIPRKQRNKPHFLQTILYMENGGYEAPIKQMTLMDISPFDTEDLESDYKSIVEGLVDPAECYRHYIIAYEAEGSELKDIQLEFLDKDFNTIATASLNEYIKPDFARLTDIAVFNDDNNDTDGQARDLLTIKSGSRPKLLEIKNKPDKNVGR